MSVGVAAWAMRTVLDATYNAPPLAVMGCQAMCRKSRQQWNAFVQAAQEPVW